MSIFPIGSNEDHRRALDRIHGLMDAEAGTLEGAELEALATLVKAYERKKYPPCPPMPLEAIIFRMEQIGYAHTDFARLLKSRNRASALLRGSVKHRSLSMVRTCTKTGTSCRRVNPRDQAASQSSLARTKYGGMLKISIRGSPLLNAYPRSACFGA